MFGEIEKVKNEVINFPGKPENKEVTEIKSGDPQEPAVIEKNVIKKEIRFARLKRSLRKRSASIL